MIVLALVAACCAVTSGCAGGSGTAAVANSLPSPTTPTTKNTYSGTQDPGLWSLTLDDSQNTFSYQPISYPTTGANAAGSGSFATAAGLLNFGMINGVPAGMAVEIPSRIATLRPGDNTTAPVAMVQQSSCFAISGNVRFVFMAPPASNENPVAGPLNYFAYGTIVASTSGDGKSWQFSDWREYQLPGVGNQPAAGTPFGSVPLYFTAQCAVANGQAAIVADANPSFPSTPVNPTFYFNQAGYFIEDVSPPTHTLGLGAQSLIGVAMSTTALAPATIASGNYAGFVYEPNNATTSVTTQPVAFAPAASVSGSLSGGIYPNDDLTQTPGSQYTIALGSQDSTLNGVFPNATLTMPDPQFFCATNQRTNNYPVQSSFDANGNPICTTAGVAVAAYPEGKYVIYFTSIDGTLGTFSTAGVGTAAEPQVLQMYLYQQ